MAKYLLLLEGRPAQLDATDEETMAFNQKWMEWAGAMAGAGKLSAGGPLEPRAKHVTAQGDRDRPEAEIDVHGFLLIEADSLDEAVKIAAQAPNIELGGAAVVRPVMDTGMD